MPQKGKLKRPAEGDIEFEDEDELGDFLKSSQKLETLFSDDELEEAGMEEGEDYGRYLNVIASGRSASLEHKDS